MRTALKKENNRRPTWRGSVKTHASQLPMPSSRKKNRRFWNKVLSRLRRVLGYYFATASLVSLFMRKGINKVIGRNPHGQHKGFENNLSGALESLIERIVKKVVKPAQIIAEVSEAVIDNSRFLALTAALVKLEQRKCTDERAKVEEPGTQFVTAGNETRLPCRLRTFGDWQKAMNRYLR